MREDEFIEEFDEEMPLYEDEVIDEADEEPFEDAEEDVQDAFQNEKESPTIISTNMTINLICTLGSITGLAGLFLYFADKRSQAVRRYAVQSVGLLCFYAIFAGVVFVLGSLLGLLPIFGGVFRMLQTLLTTLLTIANAVLRVRMMLHAYAGEAYVLPAIGRQLRTFE